MHDKIRHDAKVLIISWSPIPTPKYQKIEGSGQRFFGLATGLKKNGIKDITIAVGTIYPLDVEEVDGIKLFNYDFNDEFADKIAQYDTVIFNYAIHGSSFVFENLPDDTQVIIDAYGPAYIESLARDPEDLVNTYIGNLAAVNEVFNKILPRGDFLLYANDAQEKLYTGVLATLGSINQFSYKTQKLLRVPLGIDKPVKSKYKNPYIEYGIKEDDFVLLWFGGLYPWFDITKILDTVKDLKNERLKLVIIGGNNPQNQHPDFIKHYRNTLDYISSNNLEDQVVLIDWVDFTTRRKYYEFADTIISMNSEGKENVYSWRTRVMDYLGSLTPLITNGGDPLSDELIETGAAFKVDGNDKKSIRDTIVGIVRDRQKIVTASKEMKKLQSKYYWETVTQKLAEVIEDQQKPYSDEVDFRRQYNLLDTTSPVTAPSASARRSILQLTGKAFRKTREIGFQATYKIARDKVQRKASRMYREKFPKTSPQKPRIVIVSNQLNNTGAPFVIMDVIQQIKARYPGLAKKIKLIAFTPIESENVVRMRKMGIRTEVYTNRELAIDFHEGDVVILNSFAVSRTTIGSVIEAAKDGRLKKIFWYGHEAAPDSFVDPDTKKIFLKLLSENKAEVLAVSNKTREEYTRFFKTERNIKKMPFRFLFPEDKFRVRSQEDFNELRFVVTGSLMDMRKGQYPILYAFLDFYHNHYQKNPENYRDFQLKFTGAYEDSDTTSEAAYHVQNIKKQFEESAKGLGERFMILPTLPHKRSIEEIDKANITICYSLFEAMGIFVYEGMATGHPIIRNESAGKEEQLVEGENGFAVYSDNFAGLADVIERILNKKTTTNSDLSEMSKASEAIARQATESDYFIIDEIADIFRG